jgi:hypothetical protein
MHRRLPFAAIALAAIHSWACAGRPSSEQGAPPAPSRSEPRRNDNVITRDEMLHADVSTAYDAIVRLRPAFLRSHGNATMNDPGGVLPRVYIGTDRLGGINDLRDVDVARVEEIRYINPLDAQTLYGINHTGGVILVVRRKQQ